MPRFAYGWVRDRKDPRDVFFAASDHVLAALPPSVDWSAKFAPVQPWSQGRIGSCGPHTAAADIVWDFLRAGRSAMPSRLFIYWCTRRVMGTINQDSGVSNRDMLKALGQDGWCDEDLWPYDVRRFTEKPPGAAFQQAGGRRISQYLRVQQSIDQMKGCVAAGDPFIFGFQCYENLEWPETERTGIIPMPQGRVIGGHDVLVVGYDDATQRLRFRNSWGPGWGQKGYGEIPYAYALNPQLAGDFWTIRLEVEPAPAPPPSPPPQPEPQPEPTPAGQYRVALLFDSLQDGATYLLKKV